MAHLLLTLTANQLLNRTMFKQRLYVYDDKMVYRTRNFIKVKEVTTSYNHISQVHIDSGIFFATIEIINTGGLESITIRHVNKRDAKRTKDIIDKKVHFAHSKVTSIEPKGETVHDIEKSLSRLKELLNKGKISDKEFKVRRGELLRKL